MIIYLLANNIDVNKKLETIKLNNDDLLVAFNTCTPINSHVLKNHPNKIILCRQNSDTSNAFFGRKNIKRYASMFKEIRIFRSRAFTKEQLDNYINLKKEYPNVTWVNERKCKYLEANRLPNSDVAAQAGFVGYCMMKEQYPNATIKLVGFTRFPEKNEGHTYMHEYQFYKKNKVEML